MPFIETVNRYRQFINVTIFILQVSRAVKEIVETGHRTSHFCNNSTRNTYT